MGLSTMRSSRDGTVESDLLEIAEQFGCAGFVIVDRKRTERCKMNRLLSICNMYTLALGICWSCTLFESF